jgi:hypothetical protein
MEHDPRTAMIAQLEYALKIANQLGEATAAYLIERALDEARSKGFSSVPTNKNTQLN